MGNDKLHQQLAAIVGELQELCAVVRQNTVLSKNSALLLKRHSVTLKDLLVEHGIESALM